MMKNITEFQTLQLAIVRLHRVLCAAAEVAAKDFPIGKVAELDRQVAALLTELAAKPAMKQQLQRELNALQRSQTRLRELCQQRSMLLKQAMTRHNNNKEGLMAYQETEV